MIPLFSWFVPGITEHEGRVVFAQGVDRDLSDIYGRFQAGVRHLYGDSHIGRVAFDECLFADLGVHVDRADKGGQRVRANLGHAVAGGRAGQDKLFPGRQEGGQDFRALVGDR